MHYYQHNVGDYRKDTSHLSLLEHGIYRQLLDTYYLEETPLSNDLAKLMRSHSVRNADEKQALENVLSDFFSLTQEGYIHTRCDKGIAKYHSKSDSARASAKVRWSNKDIESDANALPTQSEGNAIGMLTNNHKPLTINHKPILKAIAPNGFELFWNAYDKKIGKPNALKQWLKINPSDELIKTIVEKASADAKAKPDPKFRKDPERWLKGTHYEDEVIVAMPIQLTELPLGNDQQIEAAYRIECGGDPTKSRFNSYREMAQFVIKHRETQRVRV